MMTQDEQIQALYAEILLMTIEQKLVEELEKHYPQHPAMTLEDLLS
jgi:hypothetical protein